MYMTKLALLVAALGAFDISAAPSPEKTSDDLDQVAELSHDLGTAINRMSVLDTTPLAFIVIAKRQQDLFIATLKLYQGISKINKANVDAEAGDFSEDEQKVICRSLHRTRYTQVSLIKRLGDQAERISQYPLTPYIGEYIDDYEKEITKFLDEVNSRLDKCDDKYKKHLEGVIKTARAQYAATETETEA